MKISKESNKDVNSSVVSPKNLKFYGTIAGIGSGMAVLFFLGFWLMSLLDRSKENTVITTQPTVIQPSANTQASVPEAIRSPISSVGIVTSSSSTIEVSPVIPSDPNRKDFIYQVASKTNLQSSPKLQQVVDSIIDYSKSKNLPLSALSITLIDAKTGEKAEYQGNAGRYPASVVKLFWLTAIYQKISVGEANKSSLRSAIEQTIFKSDNQSASRVLDAITNSKSTSQLLPENEFKILKQRRQSLNKFFTQAGYNTNLNVSQKTFPIPQENIMEPKGFDKQLRGEDPLKPIRNKITTNDAARLMYEIVTDRAISPKVSQEMTSLLTRKIDPNVWKKLPPNPIDFNPVESFFGEGLPASTANDIVSKAGWTSSSRQEVALIESKDKQTRYILAVFGDNIAYGKSKQVFPDISRLVYKQMYKISKG